MRKYIACMVCSLMAVTKMWGGQEPPGLPVKENKAVMVAEMQAAVNTIAIKYGNVPFTQIFTNEPQRAAAIRKRFMEIERVDDLSRQIQEQELQLKKLRESVQESQAVVASLDQEIAAKRRSLTESSQQENGK